MLLGRHGSEDVHKAAADEQLKYIHVGPREVSAAHCKVWSADGSNVWLERLPGSCNGVWLNNAAQPLSSGERTQLAHGDVIHLVKVAAPVWRSFAFVFHLSEMNPHILIPDQSAAAELLLSATIM